MENFIETYVHALKREITEVKRRTTQLNPVHTIFFGGGTPSVIPADMIAGVIDQIKSTFSLKDHVEISMEMNPLHLSTDYLEKVKSGGVNRISLGMQTASQEELSMLGRKHQFEDVIASVEMARAAGFENINLDIIFGLPGQDIGSFKRTLDAALKIEPPHLSLYALTVEEDTLLASMIAKGDLPELDADLAGDMYALAMDWLGEAGYHQYEISNWAIDERHQCQHNLQYWMNLDYLGFGAGAHSHYKEWRWSNLDRIDEYIERLSNSEGLASCGIISPAATVQSTLTRNDDQGETMMMGLRLTQTGVGSMDFERRFGEYLEKVYGKEINLLLEHKLLQWVNLTDGRHLRLTTRGKMVGNQVFMKFLRD
jgi:oxygen-independent coproporphyrinogen-3 oxidase